MGKMLELAEPVYDALERAAAAHTTPAARLPGEVPKGSPSSGTLLDRMRPYVGVVGSGGKETLSENCGERFTDYLEQKRREGRL